MDIFISCLTIWIAPASLMWVMLTSKWLNARAFAVGRLAEVIALVSVASATVATVLWALFAKSPVEISITGANWIGIRFDALSAIILLLVCFMGPSFYAIRETISLEMIIRDTSSNGCA